MPLPPFPWLWPPLPPLPQPQLPELVEQDISVFGCGCGFGCAAEWMRAGEWFASRKLWRVRIVACDAILPLEFSWFAAPVAATASMRTCFPITIRWTVATAAQRRAVSEFQFPSIARLEALEIILVMAIETVVVPVVTAMAHFEIRVFFGNDDVVIRVIANRRRLALLVARVAIEV